MRTWGSTLLERAERQPGHERRAPPRDRWVRGGARLLLSAQRAGTPLVPNGRQILLTLAGLAALVAIQVVPCGRRHSNPPNWDDIPGAHGSTPELEGFRDLAADFAALDVGLFALSRQTTEWQHEMAVRLRLPFPILSDSEGRFSTALALPSFATGGEIYLKRLTLVLAAGKIKRVFFPVADPASHAAEVLQCMREERT